MNLSFCKFAIKRYIDITNIHLSIYLFTSILKIEKIERFKFLL